MLSLWMVPGPRQELNNAITTMRAVTVQTSWDRQQTTSLLGRPQCAEGPETVRACAGSHSSKGNAHERQQGL